MLINDITQFLTIFHTSRFLVTRLLSYWQKLYDSLNRDVIYGRLHGKIRHQCHHCDMHLDASQFWYKNRLNNGCSKYQYLILCQKKFQIFQDIYFSGKMSRVSVKFHIKKGTGFRQVS